MYSVANILRAAPSSFDGLGARLPQASRLAPFEPGSYADSRHRQHHTHGHAPPTLPAPAPLPPLPLGTPSSARRSRRPYEYLDRSMIDPFAIVDRAAVGDRTSVPTTTTVQNPPSSASTAPRTTHRRRGGVRMRK